MNKIQNMLMLFWVVALALPQLGCAQDTVSNDELPFEVNINYPPLSLLNQQVAEADSITDLNRHYKPEWIKEFKSVEILTLHNGVVKKAVGKNDVLTKEQKNNILMADVGSDISVIMKYLPDNTLPYNDIKQFDFTFIINPECEAAFPGGQQALTKYLKENAIDKIPAGEFKGYDLAVISFTINENGQVTNPHVYDPVYQRAIVEETHETLLQAIRKMPNWKPATYANGTSVKQEFVFTVGNHDNCAINLLNTNINGLAKVD